MKTPQTRWAKYLAVLLPLLTLNHAATAAEVGTIDAQFNVSGSGAATYSVPIITPPAVNGAQPSISLSYNSQYSNGLLGVGWSMAGLQSISRCSQTKAQDGPKYIPGVDFTANDRFCLNGQRLVAMKGNYGSDGTEYRTERETWSRIVSKGQCGNGPCSFEITTTEGTVLEFGTTPDAQVYHSKTTGVAVWAMNRSTDQNNNYFTVEYINDQTSPEYYPKAIRYSGNTSTVTAPQQSIDFSYETRSDPISQYKMGVVTTLNKRLKSISTSVNGSPVKNYLLDYAYGLNSGLSRITSIKECDRNNQCLPATTIDYTADNTDILFSNGVIDPDLGGWHSLDANDAQRYITMDFNSDGLQDIFEIYKCGVKACASLWQNYTVGAKGGYKQVSTQEIGGWVDVNLPTVTQYLAMDINADGFADIVEIFKCETGACAAVWANRGTALKREFKREEFHLLGDWTDVNAPDARRYIPMDLNGDGSSDLVEIYRCGERTCANAWQKSDTGLSLLASSDIGAWSNVNGKDARRYLTLDSNNDGYPDIVELVKCGVKPHYKNICAFTYRNNTRGFEFADSTQIGDWVDVTADDARRYFPMDSNGDGLTDIVEISKCDSVNDTCVSTIVNNGKTFLKSSASSKLGIGWVNVGAPDDRRFIPLDFNNDSLVDLTVIYKDGNYARAGVWKNNNTDFVKQGDSFVGGWFDVNSPMVNRYLPMDANGDGFPDIVELYHCKKNRTCNSIWINSTTKPDLVSSISNGLGNQIVIRYKTLAQESATTNSVYTKDADVAGEENYDHWSNIQNTMYVVSEHRIQENTTNGNNPACDNQDNGARVVAENCFVFKHHYEEGVYDLNRGWLGFKRTHLIDPKNNTKTITTYNLAFPLTGTISQREIISTSKHQVLSKEYAEYASCQLGPSNVCQNHYENIHPVYLLSKHSEHYENGQLQYTLGHKYRYDTANGNLLRVSNLGDTSDPTDDSYRCIRYLTGSAQQWWQSSFVSHEKFVSDKTACDNISSWNSATDLLWQRYEYDSQMNRTQQHTYNNSIPGWVSSQYWYNSYGYVVKSRDPNGHVSEITYDATYPQYPVAVTAGGLETRFEYDPLFGIQIKETHPSGSQSAQSLDSFGRIVTVSQTDPNGKLAVVQKNEFTNINSAYEKHIYTLKNWGEPLSLKSTERYDSLGRHKESHGPGFSANTLLSSDKVTFNSKGQVHTSFSTTYTDGTCSRFDPAVCEPEVTTHNHYDQRGRIIKISHPLDVETRYEYSIANGKPTQKELNHDPSNDINFVTWETVLNSFGKAAKRISPDGAVVTYHYDLLGRLVKIVDPVGNTREFTFNSLGQKITDYQAETGTITYEYDHNGNLITQTDAQQRVTRYEYDTLDRIITQTTSMPRPTDLDELETSLGAFTQETITYVYDLVKGHTNSLGRLSKIESYAIDYYFNYNLAGDMVSRETHIDIDSNNNGQAGKKGELHVPGERTHTTFLYNALGQVLEVGYPDGSVLRNTYRDINASLEQVEFREGPTGQFKVYSSYGDQTALGDTTKVTYANGVTSEFAYDSLRRLIHSRTYKDTTDFIDLSYQWNKANKLLAITDTVNAQLSQTMAYNSVGRLVSSTGGYGNLNYSYDQAGNLLTAGDTSYVMDTVKKHQVQSMTNNGANYTLVYDQSGHLIEKNMTAGEKWHYRYNSAGRLIQVKKNGVIANRFYYDHAGNRVKKEDYDYQSELKRTTYYLSSLYEMVFSHDEQQVTHTKYIGGIASITRRQSEAASANAASNYIDDWLQYNTGSSMAKLASPLQSLDDVSAYITGKSTQLSHLPNKVHAAGIAHWAGLMLLLFSFVLYTALRAASNDSLFGQIRRGLLHRLYRCGYVSRETATHWGNAYTTGYMRERRASIWITGLVLLTFVSSTITPAYAALTPGKNGAGIPEANSVLYYHNDHLGGVSLVTDSNGVDVNHVNYEPYGAIDQNNSTGTDNFRAKFAGKELDANTGLYYFGSRYYDEDLGRFITPDPAGQFHSPYAYTSGDPMSEVDPDGEFAVSLAIFAITAVVGAYMGGSAVNHSANPADWDFNSAKTWGAMIGGAVIGAAGGAAGLAVTKVATGVTAVVLQGVVAGTENAIFAAMGGASGTEIAEAFGVGAAFGAGLAGAGAALGKAAKSVKSSLQRSRGHLRSKQASGRPAITCSSFTAGTEVSTESGQTDIEDLVVGDLVWSYNEKTSTVELNKVTSLMNRVSKDGYIVLVVNGETIETTPEHPFYVYGKGWVEAKDLQLSDRIFQKDGGFADIESLTEKSDEVQVYNFEVDIAHTYFVSDADVLVHNAGPCKAKTSTSNTKKRPREETTPVAQSAKKSKESNEPPPLYRVIRQDERPRTRGLTAKNPMATYKVEGHVLNGSKPNFRSQYISTTRNIEVARQWAAKSNNRIVAINPSGINGKIIDLSTPAGRSTHLKGATAKNFANASSEVLIKGSVPANAITLLQNLIE